MIIKLEKVSKQFDDNFEALNNISLEIKEGEFIALMGPSGSGKSTLLSLIGGLTTPTSGDIFVKEKNLKSLSDRELSHYRNETIGFIFQEFHLNNEFTVLENVLLPKAFNSKHYGRKEAEELIHEVGLTEKIETPAKKLSGGQKQRTAIARALINSPQIILADEPTGNLDLKNGQQTIDLLKELQKKHKVTLIVATHDQKIAEQATKIIEIVDGKIC